MLRKPAKRCLGPDCVTISVPQQEVVLSTCVRAEFTDNLCPELAFTSALDAAARPAEPAIRRGCAVGANRTHTARDFLDV